jgi:hypothetical protein
MFLSLPNVSRLWGARYRVLEGKPLQIQPFLSSPAGGGRNCEEYARRTEGKGGKKFIREGYWDKKGGRGEGRWREPTTPGVPEKWFGVAPHWTLQSMSLSYIYNIYI